MVGKEGLRLRAFAGRPTGQARGGRASRLQARAVGSRRTRAKASSAPERGAGEGSRRHNETKKRRRRPHVTQWAALQPRGWVRNALALRSRAAGGRAGRGFVERRGSRGAAPRNDEKELKMAWISSGFLRTFRSCGEQGACAGPAVGGSSGGLSRACEGGGWGACRAARAPSGCSRRRRRPETSP